MARQKKRPQLAHCKVTLTTHPSAPWRVSYPTEVEGKAVRLRRMFASEDAAWAFAADTDREVGNHGVRYGGLPPEARRGFDFFRDQRAELEALGATVPTFEELVTAAVAGIRADHAARQKKTVNVADAVALFTGYKKTRVGTRQLANLTDHLARFAETFGTRPVPSITDAEIESWLSSLRSRKNPDKLPLAPLVGSITRNAYRTTLCTFFKYGTAPARSWCAINPIAAIESEKIVTSEPKAYSPHDAAKIMQAALALDSPLLPALALGMFAGARPSELEVLDLSAIDLSADDFRIPGVKPDGEKTKTGARIAPLLPSAKAWIRAQTRRTGFVITGKRKEQSDEMRRILAAAGVTGIHDGARHSFISYRTAETRDVARVADEAGNSVQVIKTNYRKIVTESAALQFFAIRPPSAPEAGKVVSIKKGRKTA